LFEQQQKETGEAGGRNCRESQGRRDSRETASRLAYHKRMLVSIFAIAMINDEI
jgi:hypothetical protein